MELIKDIIKIDNRMDFGKFQTFIESENVVPDKKLDVYDIVDTMGYIVLRKVEILEGKKLVEVVLTTMLFILQTIRVQYQI